MLNAKAGVFRDVILESDYDPLSALGHTFRIDTRQIEDPIKRDLTKTKKEKVRDVAGDGP